MTIADYIAVGALMIVLILWSATRLFSGLYRGRRSVHVDLVGRCKTLCATQVLTF
jgi:hypothetical protein